MKLRSRILIISAFVTMAFLSFQNCGQNSNPANQNLSPLGSPVPGENGGTFSFEVWNGTGAEPFPGSTDVGWACHLSSNFTMDIFSPVDNSIVAQFPAPFPTKSQTTSTQLVLPAGTYNMAPDGTYFLSGCHIPCAPIPYPQISITISNSGALTPIDLNFYVSGCPQ